MENLNNEQQYYCDGSRIPPAKIYHCEGVCPKCGSNDFDYVTDDGGDRDISWVTLKCRKCGCTFTEYSCRVYDRTEIEE